MGRAVNIQIVSATGVGGLYPFVVVCFDGDVKNELYKTDATTGGEQAVWNHTFELDLTTNVKALLAAGRPEPTYLTFFLFDTGAPGVPALGSAGVLLATVRDHGRAQGDFPVVNGSGTLRLVVTTSKTKPTLTHNDDGENRFGLHSHKAKVGAAVGVAALTAGVAGLAVHHHKKKHREAEEEDSDPDPADAASLVPDDKKKKKGLFGRSRDASSDSDDAQGKAERGGPAPAPGPSRAWWDSSSSEEGAGDAEGAHQDRQRQTPADHVEPAEAYPQQAGPDHDDE